MGNEVKTYYFIFKKTFLAKMVQKTILRQKFEKTKFQNLQKKK